MRLLKTDTHVRRLLLTTLSLNMVLASSPAASFTVRQCQAEAKTELEKVYCQVLEKQGSSSLPSFNDFRRNNPDTQRLILRSPARKLGITLPGTMKSSSTGSTSTPTNTNTPKSNNKQTQPREDLNKHDTTKGKKPKNLSGLDACRLQSNQISCPRETYFLVINVPSHRLSQRALGELNTLNIRKKFANESTLQYLSDVYPYYIEKMLLIGLGDSTVSFNKFNAIYEESIKQGQDFAQRFAKMYELLKKERQTMAIKTRYQNNFPDSIEQCMRLNDKLIACDDIKQNWVYQQLIRP